MKTIYFFSSFFGLALIKTDKIKPKIGGCLTFYTLSA